MQGLTVNEMKECNYAIMAHRVRYAKCIPMTAMRAIRSLDRVTRRINPRNGRNPNREIAIFDLA